MERRRLRRLVLNNSVLAFNSAKPTCRMSALWPPCGRTRADTGGLGMPRRAIRSRAAEARVAA
jgi:hypothetical protein